MSRDYTEITDEQLRAINKRAIEQPSYEQLREQNRVLREALKAWRVYYEGHSTADNRDRAYFMTRAALTPNEAKE